MLYFRVIEVGEDGYARPDLTDTEVTQMVLNEIVFESCVLFAIKFFQFLSQVTLKVKIKGEIYNWDYFDAQLLFEPS